MMRYGNISEQSLIFTRESESALTLKTQEQSTLIDLCFISCWYVDNHMKLTDKTEYLEGNKGNLRTEYRKGRMRGTSIYIPMVIPEKESEYIWELIWGTPQGCYNPVGKSTAGTGKHVEFVA